MLTKTIIRREKTLSVNFVDENGNTVNYVSSINEYAMFSGVMMPAMVTVTLNGEKSRYRTIEFRMDLHFPATEFELPGPWYLKSNGKAAPAAGKGKS